MAISFIISAAVSLSYLTGIDANDFSNYQNPLNTFRVAKGFLWAMVFWPFLRNHHNNDPEKTEKYFICGLLAGLFLTGIGILWERGVIDDLFHWKGFYQVIYDLLDFSTTYRVTGLFSSMHVGGTAIDGYLIMVIPFCLYGFFINKTFNYQIGSLICLILGSYSIMVTFSRGLYGAFLIVILFLLIVAVSNQVKAMIHRNPLAPILLAAIIGTLLVGLFGTVIDNPRVTTLYFLIIFFGLLNTPQVKIK